MKKIPIIERLINFKSKYSLKQTVLATMLEVDKFTLNRWIHGRKISNIYQKHIEKFLDKNNC